MDYKIVTFFIILVLVIVAIFAYIVAQVSRKNRETLKDIMDIFTAQETDKIRKELTSFQTKVSERLNQFIELQENSVIDGASKEKALYQVFGRLKNSLNDACNTTMTSINASRLAIYLLHNGMMSTHGIKFFKMSCMCEKVAIGSGIREQTIDQSSIPINLFDDMIGTLITDGRYIIMNDNNINLYNHRIFISAPKIEYAVAVSIFDNNNNILGFVLAEMSHPYNKATVGVEEQQLKLLIKSITPTLSYSDYESIASKQQEDQHEH